MILNNIRNPSHGISPADIPGIFAHLSADSVQSDARVLVDNVGGRIITDTISAGWTVGSLGGIVKGSGATFTVNQTWPSTGQNAFALFAIGTFALATRYVRFGGVGADSSDPGIGVCGSNTEYIARSDTVYLNSNTLSPAPTYSFTGAMLLVADLANNEARKFASNGGVSLKSGVASAGDINVVWPGLSAKFDTSMAEIVHAGLIVFNSGLPSDAELASATKYMGAYRRLPPHWRGI